MTGKTKEFWRSIDGFPAYDVSDHGRVYSRFNGGRFMKGVPVKTLGGRTYVYKVTLCDGNGKKVTRPIHALVLEAFVGLCPDGLEGCHWDGDPAHNVLSNLRWDTGKANKADSFRHGTAAVGEKHGCAKLSEDDVRCIRSEPNFLGVLAMLARALNVSYQTIANVRSGKKWGNTPQYDKVQTA